MRFAKPILETVTLGAAGPVQVIKGFDAMNDDKGDTLEPGAYAGTAPGERLDPLDTICRLAEIVAQMIQGDDETDYRQSCAEFEELRNAQRILVLNARHVPQAVDEVVDWARGNGGLKR